MVVSLWKTRQDGEKARKQALKSQDEKKKDEKSVEITINIYIANVI